MFKYILDFNFSCKSAIRRSGWDIFATFMRHILFFIALLATVHTADQKHMFYDLNVAWPGNVAKLKPMLDILVKLGYGTVAIAVTVSKVKGAVSPLTKEVMQQLAEIYPNLIILKRLTIIFDNSTKNQSFSSLMSHFDVVAVRPMTEKALQSAATALDIDLISLDMTSRWQFYLRHKIACAAVDRGIRFEICYGEAVRDPEARKYTISNSAAIIRATRDRGIVISSGMQDAFSARAPLDVVNLACVWGLNAQAARNAVERASDGVVINGRLRNNSAKQTVEVTALEEPPTKKQRTG